MKTEIKKIDNTKREVTIEVNPEVVKNKFEEVFKKISREAKVPGFRPGHAPQDILEKHYSSLAHEEVLKELVPQAYNEAINKEALDVIELPEISEVKLERSSLSFKAKVEISPEIIVKDYKGIQVKYGKIKVDSDEIKRQIDALKEAKKLESLDDNFAKTLGYPNLAELESAIEKQIYIQKENQQRQNIEHEIITKITKDLDFKVPQSLVTRQLEDLTRQAKLDLALKGMPKEKIEEQEKEFAKHLESQAREQVKIYLVLAEIAKKEKIPIDDHMPRQVMEFLLKEANWQESS